MKGKRKDLDKEVHGAPDIAHPDDGEKWEGQTELITAFLFEMWERVEARDKKAAREARAELQTFFLNSIGQSLRVALDKEDSIASQWACKLLADVFVSIGKHAGKVRIKKPYGFLMGTKAAFREEKKKLGKVRTDVLFPVRVAAIAWRELRRAERYRKRLSLLKAGCVSEPEHKRRKALGVESSTWKQAARRQNIPEADWVFADLPEFSAKKKPFELWWKALWPFIEKKINVTKLDSHYKMARKRSTYDSQKTARDHLKTLAEKKDKGVYY